MRAVLQRVTSAAVDVGGERIAEIGQGLVVLVGVAPSDTTDTAAWMADRTLGLRIFADDDKPMNRSVIDVGGTLLVVSQFTLTADTSRGRRPSFTSAAAPEHARQIYEHYVETLRRPRCRARPRA